MILPEPPPEVMEVRPEHLRFIRHLRSEWSWTEAGAPRLALLAAGASDGQLLARVREVTGPWLVADESMMIALYRRSMSIAAAFVNHAELGPGVYEYESPFVPSRLVQEPFARSGRVEIRGGTIRLEVTPEHLALLRRANVRLLDEGGLRCEAAIDPRQPYGDSGYFYADMGEILDVEPEGPPGVDDGSAREFSEQQLKWLDDLHCTMQPALQILLQRGELGYLVFWRWPSAGAWNAGDPPSIEGPSR